MTIVHSINNYQGSTLGIMYNKQDVDETRKMLLTLIYFFKALNSACCHELNIILQDPFFTQKVIKDICLEYRVL